jgi:molecular chaperone DnaJ
MNVSVQNRTVTAQIPRGVMNGMQVQVQNGGAQPNPSQPPGDLYIHVRVRPHDVFRRENNNLIATVPVSVFDVLLKKDIEVVNIEGKTLSIALSGSRKLRLSGQGMPDLQNGVRGDLLIELGVQFPEELTEEQRDLIQKASGT